MDTQETEPRRMLAGMFTDPENIEKAYHTLLEKGYTQDEIDLMMLDVTREKHFPEQEKERFVHPDKKENVGIVAGSTIGAILGMMASVGASMAIPGIGMLVAGPVTLMLAGVGGFTGGIASVLMGAGIREPYVSKYESGIQRGHVVMRVQPKNEMHAEFIEQNWQELGAEDIYKSEP